MKQRLSLLGIALLIATVSVPMQAWARQDSLPARNTDKKGKRAEAPQAFQTGLIIRVAIGVDSIVKVSDTIELYPKATKLVARANRACVRVLDSDAATNLKKKRLLVAHQGLLRDMKALLPAQTWTKLVAAGDALKADDLVGRVRALKLCPLDDPFGKTGNLGIGDDPFENFIGETEKNLRQSAPLGGDRLIADVLW